MTTKKLNIIGDEGSHDTIRRILGERQPCKVLDIPAGQGTLTEYLDSLGWEVHAADIDPGNFLYEGVPFTEVNLNGALPFEDESFEAILCANGLHRLYNPGGAIGEFKRILKMGGSLYINVNNYASLDRRIRFLLMGSINDMINKGICDQTIDNPEAHVRIALVLPQIAGMLEANGFDIVDIQPSAVRLRDRLLVPVAWIVRFLSLFIPKHRTEGNYVREMSSSAVIPGGGYVFIEAVKRPDPTGKDRGHI